MFFEYVEWDEANLAHAARRATDSEIEQVIWNAREFRRHREHSQWVIFRAPTDGGRRLVVIAVLDEARGVVRPITAWEE